MLLSARNGVCPKSSSLTKSSLLHLSKHNVDVASGHVQWRLHVEVGLGLSRVETAAHDEHPDDVEVATSARDVEPRA